jgi:hypothetical protein
MDKNKIKLMIQEKLREMIFPMLMDDEVNEAHRLLDYLELCLWVEKK